jgi:DNA polymerase (family X)
LDNSNLVDALLEMAYALEFLDDNPFKAKAYVKAARSLSGISTPIEELIDTGAISQIEGIGKAIAATLTAWVKDHDFSAIKDLQARLPTGFDELIKVPGLGMKRLKVLCKELNIDTLDELLEAINTSRLSSVKGFSDKSIAKLRCSVQAILDYRGWFLLDTSWDWAVTFISLLKDCGLNVQVSGVCRRSMEIISSIDFLVEVGPGMHDSLVQRISIIPDMQLVHDGTVLVATCPGKPPVRIHTVSQEFVASALFVTTGSEAHVEMVNSHGAGRSVRVSHEGVFKDGARVPIQDEAEIYDLFGMRYLPPEVREGRPIEMDLALSVNALEFITQEDLKGLLHVHSTYSDGKATLADMVQGAYERGYSWLGISDHSKSAYYALGLSVKDLKRQFEEIDELSRICPSMTIFKGIESDILPDGSLDYPQGVLKQFDFVIASIHSHMDMDRATMTDRIIKAIRNPFTTILGHPTGRVLLARRPYEVDMETVLAEAAGLGVMVELNANPLRLDLDWRLIPDFTSKGGRVVIAPDAHSVSGLDDMRYGLAIARKGLLLRDSCLNAFSAREAREAFKARWS